MANQSKINQSNVPPIVPNPTQSPYATQPQPTQAPQNPVAPAPYRYGDFVQTKDGQYINESQFTAQEKRNFAASGMIPAYVLEQQAYNKHLTDVANSMQQPVASSLSQDNQSTIANTGNTTNAVQVPTDNQKPLSPSGIPLTGLPSVQPAPLDAVAAGIGNLLTPSPATVEGAAVGAGIGTAGGPAAPATVPLAAIAGGLIANFLKGYTDYLTKQANQKLGADFSTLPTSTRNLRMATIDVNRNGWSPQSQDNFNAQLNAIDAAYGKFQVDQTSATAKLMDASSLTKATRFKEFYAQGGLREELINRFKQASLRPNPNDASLSMQDVQDQASLDNLNQ